MHGTALRPLKLANIDTKKTSKLKPFIVFSNVDKALKKTKNFIVLNHGIPIRNQVFNVKITDNNNKPLIVPMFRTDNKGILNILTQTSLGRNNSYAGENIYQPVKFSRRLGYVVKDKTNYNPVNLFYHSKIISKYIDLGMSDHFLRTLIEKSNIGKKTLDCRKSSVCTHWKKAFFQGGDIQREYRLFNSHTERTEKARKNIDLMGCGIIGVGVTSLIALGSVVTAGIIASPAVLAIGGGVLTAGSAMDAISRQLYALPADVSRLKNSKITADKELKENQYDAQQHSTTLNFKNVNHDVENIFKNDVKKISVIPV